METIGKILSLTLFAMFGAAGAVIYFTDDGSPKPTISISQLRREGAEPRNDIDYSSYREQLRRSYVESGNYEDVGPQAKGQNSLWTNSYEYTSETAKRLAEGNSPSELRNKMDFWNREYQKALQSGNTKKANVAYSEYKNYKGALDIKGVF